MNSTSSSQIQEDLKQLFQNYRGAQIASGIFLVLVSLVSAVGNGLLLLTIWKDPFKTFRTPTTFFVSGLAVADFLTGIAVCPIHALGNIHGYYLELGIEVKTSSSMISLFQKAGQIARPISAATMNSSYIILLLLTWSQFIIISFPYKHKVFVTKRRVVTSAILTWAYTIVFAILFATGVEETAFLKFDLYFHTTGILSLLMVAYFCLYKAFKRQMRRLHSLKTNNSLGQQRRSRRGNRRERQFTIVNFLLLTFVIACTLPLTIIYYVHLHGVPKTQLQSAKLKIAKFLSSNVLLLKFALDPLIYAWRLTQYRTALKFLVVCRRQRIEIDNVISLTLDNKKVTSADKERHRAGVGDVEIGQSLLAV